MSERLTGLTFAKVFTSPLTERFVTALHLDDVVLGGGNAKKLTRVPAGCRMGDDAWAFLGGFRLWDGKAEQS